MTNEYSYAFELPEFPFPYPQVARVCGRVKTIASGFVGEEVLSIEPYGRGGYL